MKLSEHFDSSEFACKCGCGGMDNGAGVDPRLVQVLEAMISTYMVRRQMYSYLRVTPWMNWHRLLKNVVLTVSANTLGAYTWIQGGMQQGGKS